MAEETGKTVIEINGVKMEIDLRHAKRIDHLRVGDRVKILRKEAGYSNFEVHHGMIIGFDEFKERPTIVCAYMDTGYNGGLKFLYYNSETKDCEVIASNDPDMLGIKKDHIIRTMDREIEKKNQELQEIEAKKAFFLAHFQAYWAPMEKVLQDLDKQV